MFKKRKDNNYNDHLIISWVTLLGHKLALSAWRFGTIITWYEQDVTCTISPQSHQCLPVSWHLCRLAFPSLFSLPRVCVCVFIRWFLLWVELRTPDPIDLWAAPSVFPLLETPHHLSLSASMMWSCLHTCFAFVISFSVFKPFVCSLSLPGCLEMHLCLAVKPLFFFSGFFAVFDLCLLFVCSACPPWCCCPVSFPASICKPFAFLPLALRIF